MKSIPGKILFRKIGGKIIPIRFKNVKDLAAQESMPESKFRKILAEGPSGEIFGSMNLEIPKNKSFAWLESVQVEKKVQGKGIAKNLFKKASEFLKRSGVKFLRGSDIQSPAQVKIRAKQGRYKAGKAYKSRSRFFTDQVGPYGEQSKRVISREAIEILKNNKSGKLIWGTTYLKPKK
jgi:predicted GNAT family acetyltransferase